MRVYVAKKDILDSLLDTTGAGVHIDRPAEVDLGKVLNEMRNEAEKNIYLRLRDLTDKSSGGRWPALRRTSA